MHTMEIKSIIILGQSEIGERRKSLREGIGWVVPDLHEKGAGEALTLRDMAAVKSDSGVYEAIGKLPDVPVLQKLTESIDTATRSLNELRDEKLASMAVVGEIDADGPSATGSTEPAPMT